MKNDVSQSELSTTAKKQYNRIGYFVILCLIGILVWVWQYSNVCRLPLKYNIGTIDERFGLSETEILEAIRDAENRWEQVVGEDLFVYQAEELDGIIFNFVYDERQQATQEMQNIESNREQLENSLRDLNDEYAELHQIFIEQNQSIEQMKTDYNNRLIKLEQTIIYWNNNGGAPRDEYEQLQQERSALDNFASRLNRLIVEQNELADRINQLASSEKEEVQAFNNEVLVFNDEFAAEDGEREQGIYGSGIINIYQYDSYEDLLILLMHEMGHALGLGHTDEEQSLMYPKKNDRQKNGEVYISNQSLEALVKRCNLR